MPIREKHFGKIPDGYVIIYIDSNKYNDDICNLKAISRKELIALNNPKIK